MDRTVREPTVHVNSDLAGIINFANIVNPTISIIIMIIIFLRIIIIITK